MWTQIAEPELREPKLRGPKFGDPNCGGPKLRGPKLFIAILFIFEKWPAGISTPKFRGPKLFAKWWTQMVDPNGHHTPSCESYLDPIFIKISRFSSKKFGSANLGPPFGATIWVHKKDIWVHPPPPTDPNCTRPFTTTPHMRYPAQTGRPAGVDPNLLSACCVFETMARPNSARIRP